MIQFDFDWTEPINTILVVFVLLLGLLQLWLLYRSSQAGVTSGRLILRSVLNFLLWVILVAFVLQPVVINRAASAKALIVAEDVPSDEADRLGDSLKIGEVFSENNFKGAYFDTLILVGQDFDPAFFAKLSQSIAPTAVVTHISHATANDIQEISWAGVVRKGQKQKVSGILNSVDDQWIKLKFGSETLDSVWLTKGIRPFSLTFPVFTDKRTVVELVWGDSHEKIDFFAAALPQLKFQFILDNPDFESRSLAAWLAKHGHAVELSTNLSKDIQSNLTINKGGAADIIITDPANALNGKVKKAVSDGKSVFFMNLSDPSADLSVINSALGTKFLAKKVSNAETVPVSGELTSFPFVFNPSNGYTTLMPYPIAIEKVVGKVGVSLLNETFPTMLNGDSLLYSKVWMSVLSELHPSYRGNLEVEAPLFKGVGAELVVNNLPGKPAYIKVADDTLSLHYSPINRSTSFARIEPLAAGWMPVNADSLASGMEIAVTDSLGFKTVRHNRLIENFVKSRSALREQIGEKLPLAAYGNKLTQESRLPDWIWFLLLIASFTALWLEPKF